MGRVRIGTSGWAYKHWRADFYPPGVNDAERLAYYAARFDTAEINASFYRLPSEAAVSAWAARAPAGFSFAWKAPRFLTHYRKLADADESLALIFGRMRGLGQAIGPALFQLPPQLKRDDARLADFLPRLPGDLRHVVEFRDPSWYAEPVYDLLRAHGVALCLSDHAAAPVPEDPRAWVATAPFVYVRGHGPGGRYHGRYPPEQLVGWAKRIANWADEGRDVYAYFDNDIGCAAPVDAAALRSLCDDVLGAASA